MITGSIRVSSDEQKKKGQQINFYKDMLIRSGVDPKNILIEEARSGSFDEDKDIKVKYENGKLIGIFDIRKKRPDFDLFINEYVLTGKSKKHLINEWSRLVRNIIVQELLVILFSKNGCEIVAVNDNNNLQGRKIIGVLNDLESVRTKKRVGDNKMYKFEKGLYLGTERLYGYSKSVIKVDGRDYLHLVPNPDELHLIKDVFNPKLYYKNVCKVHGITTSLYYSIRKNKFYCGYVTYKGKEKKGLHDPLVTESEWETVNV